MWGQEVVIRCLPFRAAEIEHLIEIDGELSLTFTMTPTSAGAYGSQAGNAIFRDISEF